MKYMVSRVMTIDPGDDVTEEELRIAIRDQDETSIGIMDETGYDSEGRVICFEILSMQTTVVVMEEETSLPEVSVSEVPGEAIVKVDSGDGVA